MKANKYFLTFIVAFVSVTACTNGYVKTTPRVSISLGAGMIMRDSIAERVGKLFLETRTTNYSDSDLYITNPIVLFNILGRRYNPYGQTLEDNYFGFPFIDEQIYETSSSSHAADSLMKYLITSDSLNFFWAQSMLRRFQFIKKNSTVIRRYTLRNINEWRYDTLIVCRATHNQDPLLFEKYLDRGTKNNLPAEFMGYQFYAGIVGVDSLVLRIAVSTK
jgi:hypothetical protein